MIPGTSGQGGNFLETNGHLYTGTGGMGVIEIIGKTFKYVQESINYNLRARVVFLSEKDKNRMVLTLSDESSAANMDVSSPR